MFFCDTEELPDKFWAVSKVLLNKLATNDSQESCTRLVGDGLRKKRLASTRNTVQDDTLGWFDAHLLVEFGVSERKLDRFLKLCG
jgi:hypothetical protein